MQRWAWIYGLIGALVAASGWAAREENRVSLNVNVDPGWREAAPELPAFPTATGWLEFPVESRYTPNRYYLSETGLSVGTDGVVRYALLTQSPLGARSIQWEGLRCETEEVKVYAFGREAEQRWQPAQQPVWKRIKDSKLNHRHHAELASRYLCNSVLTLKKPADILQRLRQRQSSLNRQSNTPNS